MALPTAQLSAMSRLFSSAVFGELATKGRSALFVRLLRQAQMGLDPWDARTVGEAFDMAFDRLRRSGSRDEYIYRAAVTHRLLLGKHNLRTACLLSEFRVGECKADLAILNGTTTVFEIKSERDSLSRLGRQVANYRTVFATVFVICGEKHVEAVLNETPPEVGVLSLSSRYHISTCREAATSFDRISSLAILDSVRTTEAIAMAESMGCPIPAVPNTLMRRALSEIFVEQPPLVVHNAMLSTLKRTRSLLPLSNLVEHLPRSLHAAALAKPLKQKDHLRLLDAVCTPLEQAATWAQ